VKKYKYLVGSGCSFTEVAQPVNSEDPKEIKWLECLGLDLGIETEKTYNMGMGGSGNEFIKLNLLYKLTELLKVSHIKPSDIFVAVQWTGFERCDLFVSDEIPTIGGLEKDLEPNHLGDTRESKRKNFGWVFSGAHILRDYNWRDNTEGHESETKMNYLTRWYKYYYTHQGMWVNTLNNILFVQNFCKSHNIDYVFCTGWDNVAGQDQIHGSHNDESLNTLEQFNGFKFLWDTIDFDRFIFYSSNLPNFKMKKQKEGKISDYGGMWQYMAERGGIDPDDNHPNKHGSKVWAEYIHNTIKDRKLL
jgi:hypothetical protein